MRYEITLHIDLKLLQFITLTLTLTLLKDIAKLTSSVSKMDEMLEAAILGVQMTMILKKQFISNLFWSTRTQTFLNCQTVDI
jgi:hypothetical protein